MRYTVTWHPEARDELARIWMSAANRKAVSEAADRIDAALSVNPEAKGQPFFGDRLLVARPLGVTFSISTEDRMVQVLQVWHR